MFEKKSLENHSGTTLPSYSINLFKSETLKKNPFEKKANQLYFLILNFKKKKNTNLFLCKTKSSTFYSEKLKKLKWTDKEKLLTFSYSNQCFNFIGANCFFDSIQINSLPSQNSLTSIKKKEMLNNIFFKKNSFAILNFIKIIQNYSTLYNEIKKTKLINQYHLQKLSSKQIKSKFDRIHHLLENGKILKTGFKKFFSSSFFRIRFSSVIKSPLLLSENP